MGTTKTGGISLKGCSTSVALATGPNDEEEIRDIVGGMEKCVIT